MFDAVHVHLVINHVPFLGITAGLIILVVGLLRKSEEMKKLSLGFLMVSSLFLVPTYFSGENSEERVEDLAGVSESIIEKHDDAAKTSMALGGLLGALALLSIFLKDKNQKVALTSILVVGLLAEASIANTAKLGGQIRHTEVRDGAPTGGEEGEDKESKEGKNDKEGKEGKATENKKFDETVEKKEAGLTTTSSVSPKKANTEANENEENEKSSNKN